MFNHNLDQRLESRREFLKKSAILAIGSSLASPELNLSDNLNEPGIPFSGIQIAAHSFLDEGIDYCMNLLKEKGSIDTLMISFHAYYGAMGRPIDLMADHGKPKVDNSTRKLRRNWIDHREKYYSKTSLRHRKPTSDEAFHDRKFADEVFNAAARHGLKIYDRLYEPHGQLGKENVHNFEKAMEINHLGEPEHCACTNNPEYREWLTATIRDTFENYPFAGIQYGSERLGPIGGMLHWKNKSVCFCSHCTEKLKKEGYHPERARKGGQVMSDFIVKLRNAENPPEDGALTTFFRILMDYPDFLASTRMWHRSTNELHKLVYDTVKSVNPKAEVGRHVDALEAGMDIFYRAGSPYHEMVGTVDFIKPIIYHEIHGPRLQMWYIDIMKQTLYKNMPDHQLLDLYYNLFNLDPGREPSYEELEKAGLTTDLVYRETKRAVDAVQGGVRVYAGIGIDIPKGQSWGTDVWHSNPDSIKDAVLKTFEAGGKGVVASREYEEITLTGLQAFGDGVRLIKSS